MKTNRWVTYRPAGQGGGGEAILSEPGKKTRILQTATSLAYRRVYDLAFQGDDIWVATAMGLSHGTRRCLAVCDNPACHSKLETRLASHSASPPASALGAAKASEALDRVGKAGERVQAETAPPKTVNIGFLGPLENSTDTSYGLAMLHGAQLAIEEANARGGYQAGGTGPKMSYELEAHNDSALWGASTAESIKMALDEQVVAVLGLMDAACGAQSPPGGRGA